jgi:hypothetical protein
VIIFYLFFVWFFGRGEAFRQLFIAVKHKYFTEMLRPDFVGLLVCWFVGLLVCL